MYKVKLLKIAINDLNNISDYIALDNPFQAKVVIENIWQSMTYLEMFPFLWKEIKNWFREILAKHKYRVVYKVNKNTVYIVSVFKYKDIY